MKNQASFDKIKEIINKYNTPERQRILNNAIRRSLSEKLQDICTYIETNNEFLEKEELQKASVIVKSIGRVLNRKLKRRRWPVYLGVGLSTVVVLLAAGCI